MVLKRLAIAAALLPALTFGVPCAARAQLPAIDFSGVIFTNFQTRSDSTARAQNGGNNSSKFDVERVYLTFRMPAGERFSIRATTEILNNNDASTNSFYKGWAMRIKYAYLQWAFANNILGADGLNATARIGMLHNIIIDQEENFWPRYLSQVALERTAGMFSSADVGAALLVTLPKKLGEVYGNVVNGTSFSASEVDRFKDFGARLTITPLANSTMLGAWGKTLAVSPWIYEGKTASKFQNGGTGQVGLVSQGLARRRRGVFIGAKDPRLTLGVSLAERTETIEAGDNTTESPRTTKDVTGKLTSVFGIVRPGAWFKPGSSIAKWGVLGRLDTFRPNTETEPENQFQILSLFYEPTSKVTFSIDMQELSRHNGAVVPETKTLFFHVQVLF
jgi:hypothetical protein